MASSPHPPSPSPRPLDLELTVISAKHLKNVNWRHGDLKPYAVAYLDPDRRSATKPDDAGSTRPVWNDRLLLPLPFPLLPDPPLILTLDIFHSKPSETPKPLVATLRSPLSSLIDLNNNPSSIPTPIRSLNLLRPSGRSQGKIRIRLALRERPYLPNPNYPTPPPPPSAYYYSAPPPPRDYRSFTYNSIPQYPYDPYYYSARPSSSYYAMGPSAPADYSSAPSYDQRPKGGNVGFGTGLGVGAVAGAMGGLALEEGLKHEEGKVTERVPAREDYDDYRSDY